MKRLMTFVVVLVLTTTSAFADEKRISFEELPKAAQKFVKKFFADKPIMSVTVEGIGMFREYDVELQDGTDFEFDSKGEWTHIDCEQNAVPKGIIPSKILKYVNEHFEGKIINEISVEGRGYEVELSNQTELTFNRKFHMVAIKVDY